MHKAISDSPITLQFLAALFVLTALLATTAQAADSVGTLKFVRGEVGITSESGETRNAEVDDDLMQSEVIETGPTGLAIVLLEDDSRMTIRPNSAFRVDQLNMDDDGSESAVLNLLRGGLRLVTGLIGRSNPPGYRLNTLVATIGIRGTEFSTRICGTDCAAEESQLADDEAAELVREGLYVSVDDGRIAVRNLADGDPLELGEGESGYVSDLYSLPVKLSVIPAFQALDLIPSPSGLDFDDIEIPDDSLAAIDSAVLAAGVAVASTGDEEQADVFDISGDWETDDVDYGQDPPVSDRIWFFGASPDLEFTFTQEGNRFTGEMGGDRDGTVEGKIDGDEITFTFLLEARGGEIKPGEGTWFVQDDGSLEGNFLIYDSRTGNVRGKWTIERD